MTMVELRAEPGAASASSPERGPVSALAWPTALFVIIATVMLFVIGDLQFDLSHGISAGHVELELVALVLAFAGVVGTTVHLLSALRRAHELQRDLQFTREDAERWRSENEALVRRFGMGVEHHFLGWGLTCAEKEIALLVLRGLSYKDVANVRGTTERTVRHQALAIYRKAGVAGRAEMAAVFIRDVLAAARSESGATPPREARAASATLAS